MITLNKSFIRRSRSFLLLILLLSIISCSEDEPETIFLVDFTVSESPLVNQQVTFTNASTRGSSFTWDFGDGNTSALENPTHVYSTGGAFMVTLTVSAGKLEETTSKTINVLVLPTAAFSVADGTLYNTLPVEFANTSIAANSYAWSFGDPAGSTSTEEHPSFFYDQEGTYTVSLKASNAAGTEIFTEEITVCDFYLVGTYELSTDLSTFCGSNFLGTIDIIHEGGGVYSFSDWSFGGYKICYEVDFGLSGTFNLVEHCGVVTVNSGNDQYGDAWEVLAAISGNDLIINWKNLELNSVEQGLSTITFPNDVPFVLGD